MATFEILSPKDKGGGEAAERLEALGTGFSAPAFAFGPFWLAANRLWLPLICYLVAAIAVVALIVLRWVAPECAVWLELAAATFLALEGPGWRNAAFARRRRALVDVVEAENAETAAYLHFARAPQAEPTPAPRTGRAAPPPLREEPRIIGLFPEAGRP